MYKEWFDKYGDYRIADCIGAYPGPTAEEMYEAFKERLCDELGIFVRSSIAPSSKYEGSPETAPWPDFLEKPAAIPSILKDRAE